VLLLTNVIPFMKERHKRLRRFGSKSNVFFLYGVLNMFNRSNGKEKSDVGSVEGKSHSPISTQELRGDGSGSRSDESEEGRLPACQNNNDYLEGMSNGLRTCQRSRLFQCRDFPWLMR